MLCVGSTSHKNPWNISGDPIPSRERSEKSIGICEGQGVASFT